MATIREVWASNLESEMRIIRDVLDNYPYVSMDTEFPGVVARPIGSFPSSSDYHYQTLRCNVDLLKVVQVGITIFDEHGNFPEEASTWQFNFKFCVQDEMYAPDSIELLQKSGIDFQRHEDFGIAPNDFAELLITSGLVLTSEVKYVTFHGAYDFGYFLKLLSGMSLPPGEDAFFDLLAIWFPTIYDIKVLLRTETPHLKGSPQEVADDLGIQRIGTAHQAGSDSLLTALLFLKISELFFADGIDDAEYNLKLFGLGQVAVTQLTDPRYGATAAEREDRTIPRENGHTPASLASANAQNATVTMGMGPLPPMPTPLSANPYTMGANGPYMRTSMVPGR